MGRTFLMSTSIPPGTLSSAFASFQVSSSSERRAAARPASGLADGLALGLTVGLAAGLTDGLASGLIDGLAAGLVDGPASGLTDGLSPGLAVGLTAGLTDGLASGLAAGLAAGLIDGSVPGLIDGSALPVESGLLPDPVLKLSPLLPSEPSADGAIALCVPVFSSFCAVLVDASVCNPFSGSPAPISAACAGNAHTRNRLKAISHAVIRFIDFLLLSRFFKKYFSVVLTPA